MDVIMRVVIVTATRRLTWDWKMGWVEIGVTHLASPCPCLLCGSWAQLRGHGSRTRCPHL
jgi:hypothetical protein